jgi:dimethylamine monooxygenase subunit A
MTSSFWADPPWRGGRAGHRMGLKPVADWLADAIDAPTQREKLQLLADANATVFAETAGSRIAQEALLALVERLHGPAPESRAPLARASLLVPDDLCLMMRDGARYRLAAACVCAPSYWTLATKIGQTLDAIHAPVPGLSAKLDALMARFFEQLPEERVFERRNWLVHTDDRRYHPIPEPWDAVPRPITPAMLFVRSERQTLRRIDADTVVFTIRVTCEPLSAIAAFPEAARDLLGTIETLDADEREAMNVRHWAPTAVPFLERITQERVA